MVGHIENTRNGAQNIRSKYGESVAQKKCHATSYYAVQLELTKTKVCYHAFFAAEESVRYK